MVACGLTQRMVSRYEFHRTVGLERGFRVGLRRVFTAFVAMTALGLPSLAYADARTEARAHFKKGMDAISAGRYDDGIAELQEAYRILPHPNVLYNIARAYAEEGALEEAVRYFRRYIETNPPDKDEVTALANGFEARLRRESKSEPPPAPVPSSAPTSEPMPPSQGAPNVPPKGSETGKSTGNTPPTTGPEVGKVDVGAAHTEDVFAESIVTASKGASSPLDTANSTSIITEQDIRLSGITKIPELLRRLAGIDIMEVTGAQTELSIRGFNQRLANKTLVLVDGRSVYADILGATLWQTLSIGVEDIERIEVVRGPGSSLYGADAFNGVINIITKKPGEGKSGVAGGYGSQATTHGSLWAAGRDGELAYRLAAGYDYLPRWSREVPNGRADIHTGVSDQVESARTIRLDARGTRTFGKIGTLGIGGGLTQGSDEVLGIGPLNDIVIPQFTSTDVTTYFNAKYFDARVFWNRLRGTTTLNYAYLGQSLLPSRLEQNVVDGEIVFKVKSDFGLGPNDFRIGGAYRYKNVAWSYLDRQRVEHHYGAFLHDELTVARALSFVLDYRVDWVPYLGSFQQSPRGAVLVHPTKQSTVRASIATAFRKPTFQESYLALPVQLPVAGAEQLSQGMRQENPGFRLNAERMLSAELGYLNQDSDVFVLDTSAYYNRATNLIQLASNRPITVGDLGANLGQSAETGLYPVAFGGWENQCQAYNVYGAEAGVRTYPISGLDVYANYTFNKIVQDNSACSQEQLSRIVSDQRTSMHKVNAGVQLRTKPGVDGSIDFHYVSPQLWAEQVTNFTRQQIEQHAFALSDYTLLNARVGYRFLSDAADVSVMAFNLLDVQHREHPFGQLVGRRTMAMFSYRF